MAKSIKTIKFGENGEVYNVNAPTVSINSELTEDGTNIDFGTFENGFTEVDVALRGVEGASGDYIFITINGKQSGFITCGDMYGTRVSYFRLKKIGVLWSVFIAFNSTTFVENTLSVLEGVEKITSLSIQAYNGNTPFKAGQKYCLEGR